ncbi:hypothetical protein [Ornithinibacillus californiensis]|uniref:hypothetical protein n=1 Tax=Ornithinibacillus californiensis TaxID=161536 RepID=UPI00064D8173|nr:hypothetical protein [Ornithinibacillus californiensis]
MLDKNLLLELEAYVERNLQMVTLSESLEFQDMEFETLEKNSSEIENFIKTKRKATFQELLLEFIDESGETDPKIYKKAGLDRKHFSKIRSNPEYHPSKNTALSLALALELTREDTDKLLTAAGYSLSDSDKFDLVIQFCIDKGIYSLYEVNLALDHCALKVL